SRPVNSVVFLPDGKSLASASGGRNVGGNKIIISDLQTGEARATLEGHAAPVNQVAVSPDGKLLASASHDKTCKLWEVQPLLSEGAAGEKPVVVVAAA